MIDSQKFITRCPFCLETYKLNRALLGRVAACSQCNQKFRLIEISDRSSSEYAGTSSQEDEASLSTPPRVSNEADFTTVPQELIDEFSLRFPNPPKGVWQVGQTLLDGACQVLPLTRDKLYAEGGVGVVQRVRRRDWNVDLIVKSPKPSVVSTEFGKENFERECQTWIELGLHANIVSCYFVRRIDGIPRLFAELAPDGTLNDWISDKRLYAGTQKEALARILDVAIQFAWGLEHAHQQGLLHLDVKPGNVMTSGSTIKVTDFGLSKFVAESTDPNAPNSSFCDGMTPSYCSPEQYDAFQIYKERRKSGSVFTENSAMIPMTKQSDIWSWAISILAMFHGRSPCKMGGQTAAEVFDVFLSSLRPGSRPLPPQGMIDLLQHCFRKRPSDRPESMQVVADQIVQIYEEEIGEKYPRRQPQNAALTAESFSNKAISLLDLGKKKEALELLQRAYNVEPRNPQIAFNNALALWRSGYINDSQAVQRLLDLTRNRAFDPTSFYVFGLLDIERGNLKAGADAFKHALELDSRRKDVQRSLDEVTELLPYDSLCLTQYVLRRDEENSVPSLYVEENGDFLLLPLVDGKIALLKTLTGQALALFVRKTDASSNLGDSSENAVLKIAISEDYKWTLSQSSVEELLVEAATPDAHSRQNVSYVFHMVDWARLRPRPVRSNSNKTNPLQENEGASSNDSMLQFVPSANGVELLEPESGTRLLQIEENDRTITSFAVSSDGRWLATGGDDSLICIWNVEKKRCMRTFRTLGGVVEALWFDPKKRVVLSLAHGNFCQIWRVMLLCNHSKRLYAPHLLCSINSSEELQERQNKLASLMETAEETIASNDVGKIVDLYHEAKKIEGWETVRPFFEKVLEKRAFRTKIEDVVQTFQIQAHEGIVSTIQSSWDASFVVSAGKDCSIKLWTESQLQGELENDFSTSKDPSNSSFDSNVWKQALKLDYHADWVRSISLSPNNRFLVSGGWDHKVALWDLSVGKRLRVLPEIVRNLTHVCFAPDGRTIATSTANSAVVLWDVVSGQALLRLDVGSGYVRVLTFSRDGRYFVTSTDDAIVRFWNGRSVLPTREISGFPAKVSAIDLSCDCSRMVVGCANGKIYVVNVIDDSEKTRIILSGHLGEVTSLKLFPDAMWLVSTGKDKTIRFWDLTTGEEAYRLSSIDGEVADLSIDFAGSTLFTGAENGVVRRWNLVWDYDFPSPNTLTPKETFQLLSSLTVYYAIVQNQGTLFQTPGDYYGIKASKSIKSFADVGPLTENIVRNVYEEAVYRGLRNISIETTRNIVAGFWQKHPPIQ